MPRDMDLCGSSKVEEKEAFRNREKADEFGEARDVPIEDIEGDF